ncbi:MAG: hypothetical protein WCX08_02670 [Candidatus Buchananbacteria bacterium]
MRQNRRTKPPLTAPKSEVIQEVLSALCSLATSNKVEDPAREIGIIRSEVRKHRITENVLRHAMGWPPAPRKRHPQKAAA